MSDLPAAYKVEPAGGTQDGWQLRHQPSGLKAWLGHGRPSDVQVKRALPMLAARVKDVEALDND